MTSIITVPVILCGGSGTRLWPLSREHSPKQFIPLLDGCNLFDEAVLRGRVVCNGQKPLCVTADAHKYLVQDGLGALGVNGDILVEPVGRNTAAALCAAALLLQQKYQDAVMVVLPSDHVLDARGALQDAVSLGVAAAQNDRWVSLGIQPDRPSTEFGYVEVGREHGEMSGVFMAKSFAEKPNIKCAQQFLKRGWLWNAGIAIVRVNTLLDMVRQHQPAVFSRCQAAMKTTVAAEGFIVPDDKKYYQIPAMQIDRAVLEKSNNISVIPFDGKWSDIGSWGAVEELADEVKGGNKVSGDVTVEDSQGIFVRSPHRLTVALGLEDITIVDTEDVLLVAHKNALSGLGKVVGQLKGDKRPEVRENLRVARPWGHYDVKASEPGYKVKCVLVRPGAALSSQFHYHRAEHWIVVKGTASITADGEEREIGVNESIFIPQGTIHRLENRTEKPLELVEVQTGKYLGEDDIVRIEDVYGRV